MQPSISVALFQADDWGKVEAVESVSVFEPSLEALAYVQEHGLAITLRNAGGRRVAYLGMRPLGARRVEAWAIIDRYRTLREFTEIHRIAQEYLDTWNADRVEAFVECGFVAGHAWLKKLGFTLEASRMRKYLPDGKDCALYARVRGDDGQWECPK